MAYFCTFESFEFRNNDNNKINNNNNNKTCMMKIFTGTLKSVRPAMYIKELMEDKTLSFTIIQYKSVFVCNTKLDFDCLFTRKF